MTEARESTRFRGFSSETPRFFETLDADPCPDAWPADARVTYAAHILSPLKALVTDLEALLGDVATLVVLEARVGGSLSWPKGSPTGPDDCPVRTVRAWARGRDADRSPLLFANFSADGIEIGLATEGADPDATERWRQAIAIDGESRCAAAQILSGGWIVAGDSRAADAGTVPEDLRPWAWNRGLRVTRREPWAAWIDEPAFTAELADRFRELLPLFERMVATAPAPSDA